MAEREIRIYRTRDGREPFSEWLERLRDVRTRQKIQTRIDRVSLGNFGDARSVGGGVHELKIDFGPGYRIYFGQDGMVLVVLLCGGDKNTQQSDIRSAKSLWEQYRQEKKHADG